MKRTGLYTQSGHLGDGELYLNGKKTSNTNIYIGIDPGNKSGGMAVISEGLNSPLIIRFKESTNVDLFCTISKYSANKLPTWLSPCAMIEKVHSFPGQGVVSSFNFGENYGMLQGFLIALKIPFKFVLPSKWQRHYGLHKDKNESQTEWKRRLRQRAQELYPNIKITAETADAILIANYCKENY